MNELSLQQSLLRENPCVHVEALSWQKTNDKSSILATVGRSSSDNYSSIMFTDAASTLIFGELSSAPLRLEMRLASNYSFHASTQCDLLFSIVCESVQFLIRTCIDKIYTIAPGAALIQRFIKLRSGTIVFFLF